MKWLLCSNKTIALWGFGLLVSSLLALCPSLAFGQQHKKYALLVGCTKYQHGEMKDLYGPVNDAKQFAQLLEDRFAFPRENIETLAGWPDDPKDRPTYANIKKGFENLIARADAETQIMILLAGHGVQLPIPESQEDPLSSDNPEPDGMDEVFLPADARGVGEDKVENILPDNQLKAWLDQIRDKGSSVWIVFDCCHSGTMSRGEELERPRQAKPQDLGISDQAIKEAVNRAKKAVEQAKLKPQTQSPLQLQPQDKKIRKGSLTALYAAQAFETTPERPFPFDAAPVKENYFGLLSYNLVKCLNETQEKITYQDLAQMLVARYHEDRGARGPRPFFEGDLDQEVLGQKKWATSPIVLRQKFDHLQVSAGELQGVTEGSILEVRPPAGDKRGFKEIIGYVEVTDVTPTSATVKSCPGPKHKKAIADDKLPDFSRCTILFRNFGDMKLKVAIHVEGADPKAQAKKVHNILQQLDDETRQLFTITDDEAEAEWLLWIEDNRVHWRQGEGIRFDPQQGPRDKEPTVRKWYGNYPANQPEKLAAHLAGDIQTIFTWNNVWRIAGAMGNKGGGEENSDLTFEMFRGSFNSKDRKQVLSGTPLLPGETLSWRIRNQGFQDLWVTILYLDADFQIQEIITTALEKGDDIKRSGNIGGDTSGLEGFIVLGIPQKTVPGKPSFAFLNQKGLKAFNPPSLKERARAFETNALKTPFSLLMKQAAVGKGLRSWQMNVPSNPMILSRSWITVNPRGLQP